jgi:hypothetical protein
MIFALSLQTLRYSKLSLKTPLRRQRSAQLWKAAFEALSRGEVARYVELARRRVEESGAEAVRQLTPAAARSGTGMRAKSPAAGVAA